MSNGFVSIRSDHSGTALATALAEKLNAPVIDSNYSPDTDFLIEVKLGKLGLVVVNQPKLKPLYLDFNIGRPGQGKDPLLRAIGPKARSVVDATAGWCSDALHIARQGIQVTVVEQNRIVLALIQHAVLEITDPALKNRFTILGGNSIDVVQSLVQFADVIYLDPMYPEKNNKTAPRKKLAILRDLVIDEGDSNQLFDSAMAVAKQRVVVKRPHCAEPLAMGKVGETRSKLVRFDIYRPRNG